ncbi:C-24(28) sterol reductase [Polyrhizophydium stewartii]|uniref:Delta(24(24(1)))-sterol reductase n=1 Tax=Polyrhizophydium stewartii TaxID=2732419 RepID=A0ABR4MYX3_9FUNG|nr:C-24(28) sterol reductase [Polyrhizophydium stewartii]
MNRDELEPLRQGSSSTLDGGNDGPDGGSGDGAVRDRAGRRGRGAEGGGDDDTCETGTRADHTEVRIDKEVVYEFGGPVGVTFMMVFFPLLMFYMWACLEFYEGALVVPASLSDIGPFFGRLAAHVAERAAPTAWAWAVYWAFVVFEALLAVTMPGPVVKGLPVPALNNRQLEYLCNGVSSFYVTLVTSAVLHFTGLFHLSLIIDNLGPLMTVSILSGILTTFATYFGAVVTGTTHRMSGYFAYDLFMGAPLNPRIGRLDLKMFSEIRIPWVILIYVSLSALVKQYETQGYASPHVWFMVLAHLLYVNACMKGEECIPSTWDIFYEKWGFMLIFWNMVRVDVPCVPFTYCYSTVYLMRTEAGRSLSFHPAVMGLLFVVLLLAYYVWDTANSQKNRFRMSMAGTYIPRTTFPQLPWGTLESPKYIRTERGSLLLTSGWWGVARKIHYTADLVMALSWGLDTGFGSFIPYFYFVFFTLVLVHRVTRDMERCSKKYGRDWEEYCRTVPYIFIPFVI